uniref:Uncharacterized protein n=1 Tax=Amphilophus citrinellus TaxID=61819 RepID=A0A3Q0T2I3_AMPCI
MCTSPAMQRVQPSPFAARKSEWLRSALAHHHCPDPGVENEIVVLATGIDQYLQEVFHHLAFPSRDDTVSAKDFTALCAVLGLNRAKVGKRTINGKEAATDGERDEEDEEFRDICSGLPSQLSFKEFHSRLCGYFRVRSARRGSGECSFRLPVSEDTELVERQIRLRWPRVRRRKLAALRELVEDLRSALQGSDARCLALEVALRQGRSSTFPAPSCYSSVSNPPTSITFIQGKLVPTGYRRLRAEEAREALSLGLQQVRLIQEQAQSVPQLQSRITQLEIELHRYRYKHSVRS